MTLDLQMPNIQIHHYRLSRTDYQAEQHFPILSNEEQHRTARFINETDRVRNVCVHRFLRMKLAEQLGVLPKEIVFSKNKFGKPYVASPQPSPSGEGECRTHFNLSYRSDFALLAIADREVGIDIEQVRTIFDVDDFCSSYFHHNEKAIIDQALPSERADTIFTFWAFKEAFIKCLGIGFSRDLTEFDLSPFYHSPTHELLWWNGETFTIERIEVVEGYVGAVAYKNL